MYDNLLYLMVVIVVFSTKTAADPPQLDISSGLLLFLAKGLVYWLLCRRTFGRTHNSSRYFASQQRLSFLAIIFFAIDIYLLGGKYFLSRLPGAVSLPSLLNLGGIALFFAYLAILWSEAAASYQAIFGRSHEKRNFVWSNIRHNLPIVIPWLSLALVMDLLRQTPLPYLNRISESPWGEPLIFLLFFGLLAIFLPVMVQRLWNCTPLPAGKTRDFLEAFCRQQHLAITNIMLWPLFEGRVLTAGVMGLVGRFRYIMITPALLEALTPHELEAVMAHEIGHIKNRHLFLYLLFFLGFAILAGVIADPLWYLILTSDLFYQLMDFLNQEPASSLSFISTVPVFLFMILYFRYVFGFFMRNFERQADLHVFKAIGKSSGLVSALEKVGWMSGNIRDHPSWHHFGIGERVDFLNKCEQNPRLIRSHDQKVLTWMGVYLLAMLGAGLLSWYVPLDTLAERSRGQFAEAVLMRKIKIDPNNPLWYHLLGDVEQERKNYQQAIIAYEKTLFISPGEPEVLNNLAWLLLTAEDKKYHDASRALTLAKEAARIKPKANILDTLANAYWANGHIKEALEVEQMAIQIDPEKAGFYRKQMEKFVAPGQLSPEFGERVP